jgi:hypothetical protein
MAYHLGSDCASFWKEAATTTNGRSLRKGTVEG